jgi:uncharacterized protein YdcH (DUF465 family)
MDISSSNQLKEELIKENPIFRNLVEEHQNYESRLSELSNLTYPNDDEQLEEHVLKKKKLAVKDEMHSIMQEYCKGH